MKLKELKVGEVFTSPEGAQMAGAKLTVLSVAEGSGGRLKLTVRTKNKNFKPYVGDPDLEVYTDFCRCTNHMGTGKVAYRSQESAVEAIVRRHMGYGGHRAYPCPTSNRWHVTSQIGDKR
jgi:hypothetical protein